MGGHSGKEKLEGRVEVYRQGAWGTVCHDYWGIEDATVLCRMLGLRKAKKAFRDAKFGPGKGRIWYNYLKCKGVEATLQDCPREDLIACPHKSDAGVRCEDGKYMIVVFKNSNLNYKNIYDILVAEAALTTVLLLK